MMIKKICGKITKAVWKSYFKPMSSAITEDLAPYINQKHLWSKMPNGYILSGNQLGATEYYITAVSHNDDTQVIPVCRCGADTEEEICEYCQSKIRI